MAVHRSSRGLLGPCVDATAHGRVAGDRGADGTMHLEGCVSGQAAAVTAAAPAAPSPLPAGRDSPDWHSRCRLASARRPTWGHGLRPGGGGVGELRRGRAGAWAARAGARAWLHQPDTVPGRCFLTQLLALQTVWAGSNTLPHALLPFICSFMGWWRHTPCRTSTAHQARAHAAPHSHPPAPHPHPATHSFILPAPSNHRKRGMLTRTAA